MMTYRPSTVNDLHFILEIIKDAQEALKQSGIDQWQEGYPNVESISQDIDNETSYVLEIEDEIVATAALSFNDEETYHTIYEGSWLSTEEYAVIHRVAVAHKHKGKYLAGHLFQQLEKLCKENNYKSIKIDTHIDNLSMQRFLEKFGFTYCGIIFLSNGAKRLAFEKILS